MPQVPGSPGGFQFAGNSAPLGSPLTPPVRPGVVVPNPAAGFGPAPMDVHALAGGQAVWTPFLYKPWQQNFFKLDGAAVVTASATILLEPNGIRVGFIIRNSRTSGGVVGLGFDQIPDTADLCFAELGPGEQVDASVFGSIPQNRIYAFLFGAGKASVLAAHSDAQVV